MIDIKRYNDYNKYISDLLKNLSPDELESILKDKIFDLYKHLDIEVINKELIKIVNPQLDEYFATVKTEYDDIIKTVNTLYSDISGDLTRDLSNIKAIEKINNANIGNYKKKTITRIADVMRTGLLEKKNEREMIRDLSKIGEKVSTYAEALAKTQMMAYGRNCKAEKSNIGGIIKQEYVGGLYDSTRDKCREWLYKKNFVIDEIKKLDNGAGQPKPVLIYCGGWRCRHGWEPDPF